MSGERIEWSRPVDLPGVEILLAEGAARRWVVFHETYTTCTCLDLRGAEIESQYRRKLHRARTGTLLLMEPGEVHANAAINPPVSFRVLLIEPLLVRDAAAELGMNASSLHWKAFLSMHAGLWGAFAGFHASVEHGATVLERETRFLACLRLLLEDCTEVGSPDVKQPPPRLALLRARDFVREHYWRSISLHELAAASGLSRFHLVRAFAREFGVPPHAYQVRVQIARARLLLAAGVPVADVAAQTGFADQSHLTRHFKRIFGVTPGQYRRGVRGR